MREVFCRTGYDLLVRAMHKLSRARSITSLSDVRRDLDTFNHHAENCEICAMHRPITMAADDPDFRPSVN